MHRMQQLLDESSSIGVPRQRIDIVSPALEPRHGLWVAQMPMKPSEADGQTEERQAWPHQSDKVELGDCRKRSSQMPQD